MRSVDAYLKTLGINLFQYLDDWLVVCETFALTIHYRDLVRQCTISLGFLLN